MNELKIFQNPEFGTVRTIEIEGKIHFSGTDVAKALGYSIPSKAIQTHCRNILKWKVGVKTGVKSDGTDSIQRMEMLFIPESDLYRLIMRSQLPNAEKFSDWVCEEVLPSIRQTGSYSIENRPDSYMIDDPVERAKKWIEEQEAHKKEIEAKDKRIAEMLPGDTYFKAVCDSKLLTNFRDAGKELGMSQSQFIGWLKREKYVYSTNSGELRPMEKYRDSGLFQMKSYVNPYNGFSGVQTYLNPKGVQYFKLLLDAKNIIPDALPKHGGRRGNKNRL